MSNIYHSPCVSQIGTVNMVNSIICVNIALLFDGAEGGGRESFVFTVQIQTPQHLQLMSY